MKPHPLSEIFPPLEGAEFDSLVEDIRAHGLIQPLVMYQGKILDGSNRWRACEKLGIKPKTIDYRGSDPVGHVLSLNLSRRHLTPGQRAMIAEKLVTFTHGGDRSKGSRDPLIPEMSREKAAAVIGASTGTMKRARQVLDHGTKELQKAVADAKVEPSIAAKISTASPAKQREAVKGGKEVAREIAREVAAEKAEEKEPEKPTVRTLGLEMPKAVGERIVKEQALIDNMSGLLAEMKRTFTEYEKLTGVEQFGKRGHVSSALRTALGEFDSIRGKRPAALCPHCKLLPGLQSTCAACRGSGFIGEADLEHVEKALLADGDDAGVWVKGKWRTLASMRGDDF